MPKLLHCRFPFPCIHLNDESACSSSPSDRHARQIRPPSQPLSPFPRAHDWDERRAEHHNQNEQQTAAARRPRRRRLAGIAARPPRRHLPVARCMSTPGRFGQCSWMLDKDAAQFGFGLAGWDGRLLEARRAGGGGWEGFGGVGGKRRRAACGAGRWSGRVAFGGCRASMVFGRGDWVGGMVRWGWEGGEAL